VTEASYEQLFDQTSRTVMGGRDPDLFFEMLSYELYGHTGVGYVRKQVAMMRSVHQFPSLSESFTSTSLCLLRYAGDETQLRQLVDYAVASGPRNAIVNDARRIMRNRQEPEAIRVVELVVLEAAADLLPEPEAADLLTLVFRVLDRGGPENLPGRWQIDSKRYATASDAALSVGEAVGATGRVAERFLQELTVERVSDELWDRTFARMVRSVDWGDVPKRVTKAWQTILGTAAFRNSLTARAFDQRHNSNSIVPLESSKRHSLSEYADTIN
jgi:hypothetical protein